MEKKQEPKTIKLGGIVQWFFAIIFGLGAISALFQVMILPAIATGFLAWMWSPYFDKMTIDKRNVKYSGWVKFVIMWIVLAILSFGGMYK